MNWNCSPSRRPKLSVFVSLYCVNLLAALSCAIVLAGIASQLHCNWMLVTVTPVRPIGGCLKGVQSTFSSLQVPSLPCRCLYFSTGGCNNVFMAQNNCQLLNWNVRGLNEAARQDTVNELVRSTGATIVCLQETKLQTVDQNIVSRTV